MMAQIIEILKALLPSILTLIIFSAGYFITKWILQKKLSQHADKSLIIQGITVAFITFGIITAILMYKYDENSNTRTHIITLLGYIISGVLALSSATFFGNAIAGIMLRMIRNFKEGDFIEVQSFEGRVSERGLFHTQIQMANSDLTTIPNLYLITNPVSVTRGTGTFVSSTVSLGYDVPRQKIEYALKKAAEKANLKDAFVLTESLGDFSVVYRVQGKLYNNNLLIAVRSNLNAYVLDELHDAGIEIVSPNFMNQRQIEKEIFPEAWEGNAEPGYKVQIDNIIFDKALAAGHLEAHIERLTHIKEKCEEYKAILKNCSDEEKSEIEKKLERYEKIQVRLEEKIKEKNEELHH